MQSVSELNSFRKAAKAAGMSEEDIEDLVDYLAANPDAGDEIEEPEAAASCALPFAETTRGRVEASVRSRSFPENVCRFSF
jgi:hypothetical protein